MVEGFVGTIRYIGPLKHDPSANDTIYVGIEWDDEYRGKHNGTVSGWISFQKKYLLVGYKYFECKDGRGTLLKPERISMGVSFIEALNDRYKNQKSNVTEGKTIVRRFTFKKRT